VTLSPFVDGPSRRWGGTVRQHPCSLDPSGGGCSAGDEVARRGTDELRGGTVQTRAADDERSATSRNGSVIVILGEGDPEGLV
jgi:hypothetical protein